MSPLRFRRSLGLGPVRLNLSRSGLSPSLRLGRVSLSRRGLGITLLAGLSWWIRRKS